MSDTNGKVVGYRVEVVPDMAGGPRTQVTVVLIEVAPRDYLVKWGKGPSLEVAEKGEELSLNIACGFFPWLRAELETPGAKYTMTRPAREDDF